MAVQYPSIVIYGPPGCGMRTNAEALRRHFGLDYVLDQAEQFHGIEAPPRGALVLASEQPAYTDFSMSYALAWQHLQLLPAGYPF